MMIKEKPTTAEQQVYDVIKARIMNLELKPGQFINDVEIAESLQVSRTPVRDAFRRLEYEGLLTSQSRRGYQVSPLTLGDIVEIFKIKEALQGLIAGLAAECPDANLRLQLGDAAREMIAAHDEDDHAAWMAAHARYHEVMMVMSGYENGRVSSILSNLNDQWRRIRKSLYLLPGYRQRETSDHYAIAEAILACNAQEAEARMRSHLERVRKELVQLLENLVFPFAANGI